MKQHLTKGALKYTWGIQGHQKTSRSCGKCLKKNLPPTI